MSDKCVNEYYHATRLIFGEKELICNTKLVLLISFCLGNTWELMYEYDVILSFYDLWKTFTSALVSKCCRLQVQLYLLLLFVIWAISVISQNIFFVSFKYYIFSNLNLNELLKVSIFDSCFLKLKKIYSFRYIEIYGMKCLNYENPDKTSGKLYCNYFLLFKRKKCVALNIDTFYVIPVKYCLTSSNLFFFRIWKFISSWYHYQTKWYAHYSYELYLRTQKNKQWHFKLNVHSKLAYIVIEFEFLFSNLVICTYSITISKSNKDECKHERFPYLRNILGILNIAASSKNYCLYFAIVCCPNNYCLSSQAALWGRIGCRGRSKGIPPLPTQICRDGYWREKLLRSKTYWSEEIFYNSFNKKYN